MSYKKYINFKWLAPLAILWILALIIFVVDAFIGMPDSIGKIFGYFTLFLGPIISLAMVLIKNLNINQNSKIQSILLTLKDFTFFIGLHVVNLCIFVVIATILGPILGPLFGIDN